MNKYKITNTNNNKVRDYKSRTMRRVSMKKIILLMILLVVSFQIKAQTIYEFKIDTMYHIAIYYSNLPDLQPQWGTVLVKDLSNYNICLDNYDTMVNSFYNNSFFMLDLYFESMKAFSKIYKDSSKAVRTEILDKNFIKIIECNKCMTETDRINIDDSTYVYILMNKIIAKFYKEPIENKSFSTVDLKYDFKNYKYDYFYRFTEILECIPVDRKELNSIYKKKN